MTHPQEKGRFYDGAGNPVFEVPYADPSKGMRPVTIKDARKHGYLASVTTVIGEADKPGLTQWKIKQGILSALTLPKIEGESLDDFAERALRDSKEQSIKAAADGTLIHAAIEGRKILGEFKEYVKAAASAVADWLPENTAPWTPEQSFSHPLGFGGKVDDHAPNAVVDYKSTDKPLDGLETWIDHAMQLAAYREGLGFPEARCAIVYVSRIKPEARLIEIPQDELAKGWKMFQALLAYYRAKNNL